MNATHPMRDAMLDAKAAELVEELNTWATQANILRPGEVIAVSMRFEKRDLVVRHTGDTKGLATEVLRIAGKKPPVPTGYTRYVAPARLTPEEVERILNVFDDANYRVMSRVLITNRNNPCKIGQKPHRQHKINVLLHKADFDGKHYMLVGRLVGAEMHYQLWVVE